MKKVEKDFCNAQLLSLNERKHQHCNDGSFPFNREFKSRAFAHGARLRFNVRERFVSVAYFTLDDEHLTHLMGEDFRHVAELT